MNNIYEYDKNYLNNGFIQFEAARFLIDFSGLSNVKNILDVGCGSGRVTKELFHWLRPEKMVAIDKSAEMINEARQNVPNPNIVFQNSSIEGYTNTNKEKFELIFSNSSFAWFTNYQKALTNIIHATSADGMIVIQASYKKAWCPEFVDIISSLRNKNDEIDNLLKYHYFPCMHFDTKEEYIPFLEQYGLQVDAIETKDFTYNVNGQDAIKIFNSGAVKVYTNRQFFTKPVSDSSIKLFYDVLQKTLIQKDDLTLTYPRIFIKCRPLTVKNT